MMTILFFMWGFVNVLNDILIPRFKEAFTLNYFQAMLVQLAFFGAYSIGGLVYYLVSMLYVFFTVLLVAFFLSGSKPHRMVALFSGVIICLMITGIFTAGETAKWAILCVGLFCSVMWSNIFSLAIEGLGPLKSQASSLLVIAILGGALVPPTQGAVADHWGIQFSFVVPIVAFAYIAFYGLYGYRAGRHRTAAP